MHEIEHISHYYTQGRSSILLDILVGPSTCSHVSLAETSTQPEFEFHFILNQDFKTKLKLLLQGRSKNH